MKKETSVKSNIHTIYFFSNSFIWTTRKSLHHLTLYFLTFWHFLPREVCSEIGSLMQISCVVEIEIVFVVSCLGKLNDDMHVRPRWKYERTNVRTDEWAKAVVLFHIQNSYSAYATRQRSKPSQIMAQWNTIMKMNWALFEYDDDWCGRIPVSLKY